MATSAFDPKPLPKSDPNANSSTEISKPKSPPPKGFVEPNPNQSTQPETPVGSGRTSGGSKRNDVVKDSTPASTSDVMVIRGDDGSVTVYDNETNKPIADGSTTSSGNKIIIQRGYVYEQDQSGNFKTISRPLKQQQNLDKNIENNRIVNAGGTLSNRQLIGEGVDFTELTTSVNYQAQLSAYNERVLRERGVSQNGKSGQVTNPQYGDIIRQDGYTYLVGEGGSFERIGTPSDIVSGNMQRALIEQRELQARDFAVNDKIYLTGNEEFYKEADKYNRERLGLPEYTGIVPNYNTNLQPQNKYERVALDFAGIGSENDLLAITQTNEKINAMLQAPTIQAIGGAVQAVPFVATVATLDVIDVARGNFGTDDSLYENYIASRQNLTKDVENTKNLAITSGFGAGFTGLAIALPTVAVGLGVGLGASGTVGAIESYKMNPTDANLGEVFIQGAFLGLATAPAVGLVRNTFSPSVLNVETEFVGGFYRTPKTNELAFAEAGKTPNQQYNVAKGFDLGEQQLIEIQLRNPQTEVTLNYRQRGVLSSGTEFDSYISGNLRTSGVEVSGSRAIDLSTGKVVYPLSVDISGGGRAYLSTTKVTTFGSSVKQPTNVFNDLITQSDYAGMNIPSEFGKTRRGFIVEDGETKPYFYVEEGKSTARLGVYELEGGLVIQKSGVRGKVDIDGGLTVVDEGYFTLNLETQFSNRGQVLATQKYGLIETVQKTDFQIENTQVTPVNAQLDENPLFVAISRKAPKSSFELMEGDYLTTRTAGGNVPTRVNVQLVSGDMEGTIFGKEILSERRVLYNNEQQTRQMMLSSDTSVIRLTGGSLEKPARFKNQAPVIDINEFETFAFDEEIGSRAMKQMSYVSDKPKNLPKNDGFMGSGRGANQIGLFSKIERNMLNQQFNDVTLVSQVDVGQLYGNIELAGAQQSRVAVVPRSVVQVRQQSQQRVNTQNRLQSELKMQLQSQTQLQNQLQNQTQLRNQLQNQTQLRNQLQSQTQLQNQLQNQTQLQNQLQEELQLQALFPLNFNIGLETPPPYELPNIFPEEKKTKKKKKGYSIKKTRTDTITQTLFGDASPLVQGLEYKQSRRAEQTGLLLRGF